MAGHFTKNRIKLLLFLFAISLFFIYLRVKTIGHLLMWDEAWNILSLRAFILGAVRDPFYWFYNFHPPLYMLFAKALNPLGHGIDIRLEWLSLVISYGCFLVTFFLAARIGGWKLALFSGLFLCIMPCSIAYDTWIKSDNLASLFGYSAIFLLLRKKYFWCAVSLSLSFLSKENAFFFALAVFGLLFFLKTEKPLLKAVLMSLVIIALASWWYILTGSSWQKFYDFYFSTNIYKDIWTKPSIYYLKKLVLDLSPLVLILFIIGLVCFAYKTAARGKKIWMVPVFVFLCVYVPISFLIKTKTPWLVLSAKPAMAMIAGGGVLWFFKLSKKIRIFAYIAAIFMAIVVFSGFDFSYSGYHEVTYPNGWPGALASRKLAYYLNENMRENDKLLITHFTYWNMPTCPIFLYYWDRHPISVLGENKNADEIIEEIKKTGVSWFALVDSPDPARNLHGLAKEMNARFSKPPAIVGWSYVWDTQYLIAEKIDR